MKDYDMGMKEYLLLAVFIIGISAYVGLVFLILRKAGL